MKKMGWVGILAMAFSLLSATVCLGKGEGFVITTTAGANGSLSPENPTVEDWGTQTILIQPDAGYWTSSILVDGVAVDLQESYTFNDVLEAHTIEATFAPFLDTAYVDAAKADDSGDGSSLATAKKTIQAAIDVTAEGGKVWVAAGVYNEGGVVEPGGAQFYRVYFPRPMSVESVDGADVTSIIGAAGTNGSNDVDSVSGVCITERDSALIGFTVSGGYTVSAGYDGYGAGVYLSEGSSVSNCTIRGNHAYRSGGGVYLANEGLVTHCTIQGNHAELGGGGVFLNYGGMMSDCVVSGNTESWNGGGGASIEGAGVINSSTFYGNSSSQSAGGGIKVNSGMVGGAVVNNCLVFDNQSTGAGGGICGDQSIIINCTLAGNTSQDSYNGGGGFGESMMGGSSLYNCIIWGNTAPTNSEFYLSSYGSEWDQSVVSNVCASSGVTAGVDGCITADPLFVDVATTNYQLQASSPCLDAGVHEMQFSEWDESSKTSVSELSATDLAGNPRVVDTVDIGAYESQTSGVSYEIVVTEGPNGSVSPSSKSSYTIYEGHTVTFTLLPKVGYKVATLTVDGVAQTVADSYTFTDVQANHTLNVTFEPKVSYTITVISDENGSVSPATTNVLEGADIEFSMIANAGYNVGSVQVDGVTKPLTESYEFTDVRANHTLSVTFDPKPIFAITSTAGLHGSVSPLSTNVMQGSGATFSLIPDAGYEVDSLTVNGATVPAANSYTFSDVQAASTLRATFKPRLFGLTVNGGTGSGTFGYETVQEISAPAIVEGQGFAGWEVTPASYSVNLADAASATTQFTIPMEAVTLTPTYREMVLVSNLSVAQIPGEKTVKIGYDVAFAAADRVSIALRIEKDGVEIEEPYTWGTQGDYVQPGEGKSMWWSMWDDFNGEVGELTFTVIGSAEGYDGSSVSTNHFVDARDYIVTVNSGTGDTTELFSAQGIYDIYKWKGSVRDYPDWNIAKTHLMDEKEGRCSSSRFRSIGYGNNIIRSWARGAYDGAAKMEIDPSDGYINVSAHTLNMGGPAYFMTDGSTYKSPSEHTMWGLSGGACATRRMYEVIGSGTNAMTLVINWAYEGRLHADENDYDPEDTDFLSARHSATTWITRVKDRETFFASGMGALDQNMTSDIEWAQHPYDLVFGDGDQWEQEHEYVAGEEWYPGQNDQDVASLIWRRDEGRGADDGEYSTETTATIEVYPGDMIILDNFMGAVVVCMNPGELMNELSSASARDCSMISGISLAEGSAGSLKDFAYFSGVPLGSPEPDAGENYYCWGSTVSFEVDDAEGHAFSGWTGTGSIPETGSAMSTGEITLTNLNSSITWNWDLVGYKLGVENGTGSGAYEDGAVVSISANPVNFSHWSGDHAEELADPTSATTTLVMPDESTSLVANYLSATMYVDAAQADDSQDGFSWETAKKTIQAAVDAVAENGTVWVTNGVYDAGGALAPAGAISNRVCMTFPVYVRSVNGAEVTTIVADSIRGVYMSNGSELTGFTIRNGNAYLPSQNGVYIAASNNGGALYLADGVVNDCIMADNCASSEGGAVYVINGVLNNCLIYENTAPTTGGVYMNGAATLNNCTVTLNSEGGVTGMGDLFNCIIWDNTSPNLNVSSGVISNTCASSGVTAGVDGCMTDDPLFADPNTDNFQLQSGSPCIDQGDNDSAPEADGLGDASRVITGSVDMGAYEHFVEESDTDSDGVPDWWEKRKFGGVTNAVAQRMSANNINTVKEAYIAGLDPKNPASRFMAKTAPSAEGKPGLEWEPVRGRVYSILWTPDLATDFVEQARIPWTQERFEVDESGGFYKIEVELE